MEYDGMMAGKTMKKIGKKTIFGVIFGMIFGILFDLKNLWNHLDNGISNGRFRRFLKEVLYTTSSKDGLKFQYASPVSGMFYPVLTKSPVSARLLTVSVIIYNTRKYVP